MATQLCRGVRDDYFLSFKKISKSYPVRLDGTYVNGDSRLVIGDGRYSYYKPSTSPYTCQEFGIIVDNGDGTVTMTPTIIIGCGSGVSGYVETFADLPTCNSTISDQIYQVGEMPGAEWYQCTCLGGSCSWVLTSNPICEEIDSILDLPDTPCSGSKIYYGSFASDGSNIFYGCVNGDWRDVVNPNDPFSEEGVSCVGLSVTIPFGLAESYTPPKNDITAFSFTTSNNTSLDYDIIGVIDVDDAEINVKVPYGTAVNGLVPSISISGAKVQPNTLESQDFTNDVIYRCFSSDGTIKDFTVKVQEADVSEASITEFWFEETNNDSYLQSDFYGIIDGTIINVTVPYGTTVTSLIPSFKTNAKTVEVSSTTQVSGTTSNDYSSAVTYVCYDQNDNPISYTINVFVSDTAIAKAITKFLFRYEDNEVFAETHEGTVTESTHTISINVPTRVNFSSLYPTIYITGVSVSPKSRTEVSFSSDDQATFTVTDSLGGTQDYTATITAADDPDQRLDFRFHSDDEDDVDDLSPSGWVKNVNLSTGLPDSIVELLNNASSHLTSVNGFLKSAKSALNIAKILLTGVGNPILSAFDFFLGELISLIQNLKNSGFYYCQIIPDAELFRDIFVNQALFNPYYRDGKLEKLLSKMNREERKAYDKLVLSTRDLRYWNFKGPNLFFTTPSGALAERDPVSEKENAEDLKALVTEHEVLQTLSDEESILKVIEAKYIDQQTKSGFWLLTGTSALKIFADSFDNPNDPNQPLYNRPIPIKNYSYYSGGKIDYKVGPSVLDKTTVLAGGTILWIGINGGTNMLEAIKTFVSIIRQLVYFFNDPKLKALIMELQELQNKFWGEWKPNTKYYIGDVVTKTDKEPVDTARGRKTLDRYKYVCTRVSDSGYGTSGSTEPTWPEIANGVVTDNDITWTEGGAVNYPIRTDYPKIWQQKKIFRDWFKSGGEMLDNLEYFLTGFRERIPSGSEAIDSVVDYIDTKLGELTNLINMIENFLTLIDTFSSIGNFNMSAYMVPVQNGGIDKLIEGALDSSDVNKPSDQDFTLALYSFIGTGAAIPGYLLLIDLLFGAGDYPNAFKNAVDQAEFPYGLDTLTELPFLDEEYLKNKWFDEDKVRTEIEAESDSIETNSPF